MRDRAWTRRQRAANVGIAVAALGEAAGFAAINLPAALTALSLATAAYCLHGAIRGR